MFVTVIIVNFIASVLAICGLINVILFCCDGWEGMDIAVFSLKLAVAVAPFAVAALLYLLGRIARMLESLLELGSKPKAHEPVYGRVNNHRMFGAAADTLARTVEATESQPEPEAHTVEGQKRDSNAYQAHAGHHQHHATSPAPAAAPLVTPQEVQHGSIFHIEPMAGPVEPTTEKPIGPAPAAPVQITDKSLTPPPLPVDAPAEPQPPAVPEQPGSAVEPPPARPQDPSLNFFRTN